MPKIEYTPSPEYLKYKQEQEKRLLEIKNRAIKPDPKPEPKVKDPSPLNKKKEPTGELSMFKEIWKRRRHISFVSGARLGEFSVSFFAHVISKAQNKYYEFKLYPRCVVLLTQDEHHQWDNGVREELAKDRRWKKMFDLEAELKAEYMLCKKNGEWPCEIK